MQIKFLIEMNAVGRFVVVPVTEVNGEPVLLGLFAVDSVIHMMLFKPLPASADIAFLF